MDDQLTAEELIRLVAKYGSADNLNVLERVMAHASRVAECEGDDDATAALAWAAIEASDYAEGLVNATPR